LVDAISSMSIPSDARSDQINLYLIWKWQFVQYSKGGKNFQSEKFYTLQSNHTTNYSSYGKVTMYHALMMHSLRCTEKCFDRALLRMSRLDVKYRACIYHMSNIFTLFLSLLACITNSHFSLQCYLVIVVNILDEILMRTIPVVTRSKEVCSRLVAGIAGSNPARGMDVCLLCLYVVFSCLGRGPCDGLIARPEEFYRVSNSVWLETSKEEGKARFGL
jgi:hypothetical protein